MAKGLAVGIDRGFIVSEIKRPVQKPSDRSNKIKPLF